GIPEAPFRDPPMYPPVPTHVDWVTGEANLAVSFQPGDGKSWTIAIALPEATHAMLTRSRFDRRLDGAKGPPRWRASGPAGIVQIGNRARASASAGALGVRPGTRGIQGAAGGCVSSMGWPWSPR